MHNVDDLKIIAEFPSVSMSPKIEKRENFF